MRWEFFAIIFLLVGAVYVIAWSIRKDTGNEGRVALFPWVAAFLVGAIIAVLEDMIIYFTYSSRLKLAVNLDPNHMLINSVGLGIIMMFVYYLYLLGTRASRVR